MELRLSFGLLYLDSEFSFVSLAVLFRFCLCIFQALSLHTNSILDQEMGKNTEPYDDVLECNTSLVVVQTQFRWAFIGIAVFRVICQKLLLSRVVYAEVLT